jgi:hypothetical protein
MALKQTIQTQFGIEVVDAYVKVERVTFDDKNTMRFVLATYATAGGGYPPVQESQRVCVHDMNGPNAYAQAYAFVKTLPEFANAKDC